MMARALYPSMMMRGNISFDSFYGFVLDPLSYKMISYLNDITGNNSKPLHQNVFDTILSNIINYVDKLDPQSKQNYKQEMYFIMAHMLTKLKERNINIMKLFNQNTYEEFSILKTFLIPFLEMFIKIHPKGKEYNTFAYDYLLNGEWETKILYIVENFNDNNSRSDYSSVENIFRYILR